MNITDALLTISNYNRPGTRRKNTTAIACHYIGNPGTSAQANRNWFESLKNGKGTKASCHYIIGLQGEIFRLIPEEEISWCTNSANSYTISIEACHPDSTGKFTDATYSAYTRLCADICSRWGLDPEHGGLIRHYDVTRKICPKWFVDQPGEWEKFKKDVAAKMQPSYEPGWNRDRNGWWYADTEKTFYQSCWRDINGHRYYFNQDGYAVTDWQVVPHPVTDEHCDFYFEPRAGHPLECALYCSTDLNGAQYIGEF